jgi:hypothetical protein
MTREIRRHRHQLLASLHLLIWPMMHLKLASVVLKELELM